MAKREGTVMGIFCLLFFTIGLNLICGYMSQRSKSYEGSLATMTDNSACLLELLPSQITGKYAFESHVALLF